MNIMESLDKAERLILKGVDELTESGDINGVTLEMLGKAVDAIKDIHRIRHEEEGTYAEAYGDHYTRGYGARRDGRGRFMEGGYDDGYRRGGSRYGDWDEKREEREMLEQRMRNATNDREREMYRQKLEQL